MNIYQRAASLKLRLETSQRNDQHQDLRHQATSLLSELRLKTASFGLVIALQEVLDLEIQPRLDTRRLRQAVDDFRSALTQHNAAAVQQQAAVTLRDAAKRSEDSVVKWARSMWQAAFEDLSKITDQDDLRSTVGPPRKVARLRSAASQLRVAIDRNPIRDLEAIQKTLQVDGLEKCVAKMRALGDEVCTLLAELQQRRTELPAEVQNVLKHATSDGGFPLEDMTEGLLDALRESGLLGEFVVRRY